MNFQQFLREMNQAKIIARGINNDENTIWYLFGVLGLGHFTIEIPMFGDDPPVIVGVDNDAAAILYDEAVVMDSDSLVVRDQIKGMSEFIDDLNNPKPGEPEDLEDLEDLESQQDE